MKSQKSPCTKLKQQSVLLFMCICIGVLCTNPAAAATKIAEPNKPASIQRGTSSHPYCGIYCLYTIMQLANLDVDIRELIKPEYIGSPKGSSFAELKKAAEEHGMYAVPISKMTRSELRASPYPIILHVRFNEKSKKYDHFELFLGMQGDNLKLFDLPNPVRLVPFYELAPRWDGTGLIVSANPVDLGPVFAGTRRRFIIYAVFTLAIVLAVRWGRNRWFKSAEQIALPRRVGLSLVQAAGLTFVTLFFGMFYHFVSSAGFLSNTNSVTFVEQAHLGSFIPKLAKNKVAKLLDTDTVLIDARRVADYEAGHLDGAINIPVDSNDTFRHDAMRGVDKSLKLVLYCQSSRCPFAETVAAKLKSDGFSNLSIYKGGWNDWKSKK